MMSPMLFCPLAIIGISSLYVVWNRIRLGRAHGPDHQLRERVAYMLWVAATRA